MQTANAAHATITSLNGTLNGEREHEAFRAAVSPLLVDLVAYIGANNHACVTFILFGGITFYVFWISGKALYLADALHDLDDTSRRRDVFLYRTYCQLSRIRLVAGLQLVVLACFLFAAWHHHRLPLELAAPAISTLVSLYHAKAATRALQPLYPDGMYLDTARWNSGRERKPQRLVELGIGRYLSRADVLQLRSEGYEPEQWKKRPQVAVPAPEPVKEETEQERYQRRSDAWDAEWFRRWEAERPARERFLEEKREEIEARRAANEADYERCRGDEEARRQLSLKRSRQYHELWNDPHAEITVGIADLL
jgi:hypothetical protein